MGSGRTPVKRIDHIIVRCPSPEKLFLFFTTQLKFPQLWSMTDFGPFVSGSVYVGNCMIEIMKGKINYEGPAHPLGFGLEPWDLDDLLQQLEKKQIETKEPGICLGTLPNGKKGILFTSVIVPSLRPYDRCQTFVIDWSPEKKTEFRNLIEKFGPIAKLPLSVNGVSEVMTGVPKEHLEQTITGWEFFLKPDLTMTNHLWNLGGIKIGFRSIENGHGSITLKTLSLDGAKKFLGETGFQTENRAANKIFVKTPHLQGLDLFLEEATPPISEGLNPYKT